LSTRLFAAALVAAFSLTACQGGTPTTPGNQAIAPAKGMAIIKGMVTTSGVIAAGGGNVISAGGGNVISAGGGNFRIFQAGGVAGASLQVKGGAHTSEITTGADGSFSVQVPQGSTYTLTASHPDGKGGIMKQVAVVEVPTAEEPPIVDVASLVTRRTGSIQGVVALAGGADPEGADVFVPGTTIIGKVSAKGRFALANVPEGTWNIVFQKPGFKRAALTDLAVQAGRPLVLTDAVTLEAGEASGGQLKGLIRDNQGRAVVGATVTATDAKGVGYTGTSDGQGNVAIAGLPDGTYSVQVYRSFYQVPAPKEVTLTGGAGGDLGTVSLASTVMHFGKISGRLLDEAGEPIDGAVVQLDPPTTESVFTDARGNFTLDRVMPGEYTLRAAAGGFEVGERDVLVDNQPGFTAAIGDDFTLRQPFDPAKPKKADRNVAKLLPPNVKTSYQGDDLVISWDPVGLPPGITKMYYDLEGQAAPSAFMNLATTEETQLILKGFGKGKATFNLVARPAVSTPAGYRVLAVNSLNVSAAFSVGSMNIQGMDLETAMMAVQTNRANLLEAQLKDQIASVQAKNDQVAKFNTALGNFNKMRSQVPSDLTKADASIVQPVKAKDEWRLKIDEQRNLDKVNKSTGVSPYFQMTVAEYDAISTLGHLDARIQQLKSQIDSLQNSQQMDMLRLQSMSNKRNEAFDIMTNFIKKMQENRSSIIGNMR
jgi:hypothetical protein